MSRRFGRNQKRRMREQIEALLGPWKRTTLPDDITEVVKKVVTEVDHPYEHERTALVVCSCNNQKFLYKYATYSQLINFMGFVWWPEELCHGVYGDEETLTIHLRGIRR